MKKTSILLLLAAATVLVSCKKDNLGASAINENEGSTVSAVIDDDNSKTTLDGAKVLWTSGDAISINGKRYTATPDASDARKATFALGPRVSAPTTAPFCAYYPTTAYSGTKGQFVLSSTQNYGIDDKITNVNPMYAVVNDLNETFHFKNVCGLLTIDLKGEGTVSNITISANEYLAGVLTDVAISDKGELTYKAIEDDGDYASKSVSLGCGEAATLSKETARRFYIALPEGDFTGVKLSVTTDAGTVVFPATKTVSIKKNNIYHLPETTVEIKPLEFNADLSIDKCEATSPSSVDLAVSIEPEDKDVYYIPAVESASYVSQFEDALELARADMAYWKSKGGTSLDILVDNDIAIKGDDLEDTQFSYCKPESDYVLYVFAVDENLNVSPAIELPFTTPAFVMPVSDAKYEDYLGQWTMGTDLITISQKESGSTYNMTGFKSMSMTGTLSYNIESVEASFQDGYIVLNEQFTGVVAPVGSYGPCDFYFSGVEEGESIATYPFYSDTPETIFQGRLDGDTIVIYPGSTSYGTFGSVGISWQIQSGSNAGKGNTIASSKLANMKKYVEPVGPTPEGKWYCASVTDYWEEEYTDWTLDITKDGAGYAIDNFDIGFDTLLATIPLKALPATASWDPESLTLTVEDKTNTGISAGSDILWRGISNGYYSDIVLKFDFEANTCTLQTGFLSTDGSGAYSRYDAGVVFTKVNANSAPRSNVAGNKAGKHFEGMNADFRYPQIQMAASATKEHKPIKADNVKKSFRNIQ